MAVDYSLYHRKQPTKKVCAQCNQLFEYAQSPSQPARRFCSKKCSGLSKTKSLPPCKTCGKPVLVKGRKYCSKECKSSRPRKRKLCRCGAEITGRYKGGRRKKSCESCIRERKRKSVIKTVSCVVCGKSGLKRTVGRLEKHPNPCCGIECQNKWSLIENRGRPHSEPDWARRSAKAKAAWGIKQSRLRRERWWKDNLPIRRAITRFKSRVQARNRRRCEWEIKIQNRIVGWRRRPRSKQRPRNYPQTSIKKELARLAERRRWHEQPDWEKKLANKLSNMNARRRKREEGTGGTNKTKADRQWVQMCFDWVGHNAGVL